MKKQSKVQEQEQVRGQQFTYIRKSCDPGWVKWAVSVPHKQTEWFSSYNEAVTFAGLASYPIKVTR